MADRCFMLQHQWLAKPCAGPLIVLSLCLLTGCGQSTGNRVSVGGSVTNLGDPVMKATITFQPVDGKAGNGGGGDVYNGRYHIPREAGPSAGQKYKVVVMTQPEKFLRDKIDDKVAATLKNKTDKQYVLETEVEIPQKDTTTLDLVFE